MQAIQEQKMIHKLNVEINEKRVHRVGLPSIVSSTLRLCPKGWNESRMERKYVVASTALLADTSF